MISRGDLVIKVVDKNYYGVGIVLGRGSECRVEGLSYNGALVYWSKLKRKQKEVVFSLRKLNYGPKI